MVKRSKEQGKKEKEEKRMAYIVLWDSNQDTLVSIEMRPKTLTT